MSSPPLAPTFSIYYPPTRPPSTSTSAPPPSVLLYGSMLPPRLPDWRLNLSESLSDLPITILNPTCAAWESTWVEDISFAPFAEQAEWEMWAAGVADVIVFYFAPGTQAPISLLELGLYVAGGKCVVCCPEGFWKRGNVQIVCRKFGVEVLGGLEELERVVRDKVEGLVEAEEELNTYMMDRVAELL